LVRDCYKRCDGAAKWIQYGWKRMMEMCCKLQALKFMGGNVPQCIGTAR
jgi:hypothetical protein